VTIAPNIKIELPPPQLAQRKSGAGMACSEKHILNNVSKFISINLSCLVNCIIDGNEQAKGKNP
jgi:hypothetical protein